MVLMALDHTRDFFHFDAFFYAPTDLSQTDPAQFFTRFITHFCAPVFVFLAGTSAYFVGLRKGKKDLSIWLIKRGIWLVIVEVTIVKLAWYFKLSFHETDLMVIWVLGVAMIALAGLIHIPKNALILICLVGIFTHNLFDGFQTQNIILNDIWIVFHVFAPIQIGNSSVFIAYPLIPWIFVMPLGYYFGSYYNKDVSLEQRCKALKKLGFTLIFLFIVLRMSNLYGDNFKWESFDSFIFTMMSFLNVSKYPPSLLYLLVTLGPAILFLAYAEEWKNKLATQLITIGRVPMFYYIIHIYIIHLGAVIAAEITGFGASIFILDTWVTDVPEIKGFGFSLWVVYLIWVLLIIGLYPLCKWYENYKRNNRDKWWLSYL